MNLLSFTHRLRYLLQPVIAGFNTMRYVALLVLFAGCPAVRSLSAQTPPAAAPAGAAFVSVSGTVASTDVNEKTFTVKTDKGDSVVKYDDRTAFLRMAPGETDLKKAVQIQKTDVETGDRVLARVRTTSGVTNLPATRIIVITAGDLAKRDEKVQEDWATRSTTGIVASIDPSSKQIVMKARGKDITVDAAGKVTFRRYNPESTKAADMKMSSLAEITPGDQLRVLGVKNDDQTKITAESIVSGSFRTVGVVVKSIDIAGGTITGIDAATKKPVVIKVTADSQVKRLEPMAAMMMARQLNPNYQAAGGRGAGGPGGAGGGPGGARPAGIPAVGAGPGGAGPGGPGAAPGVGGPGGGGPGGMRGGGRPDAGKMLESQPTIQLSELKLNDALIVYGLATSDLSKLTALNVIAGAEAILTAAPKGGADPLGGSWNFGEMGAPQ